MQTFSFRVHSSPKFPLPILPHLYSHHTEGPGWCLVSSWGHVSLKVFVCVCVHVNELCPQNEWHQANSAGPAGRGRGRGALGSCRQRWVCGRRLRGCGLPWGRERLRNLCRCLWSCIVSRSERLCGSTSATLIYIYTRL